jgi:hypothetical protein
MATDRQPYPFSGTTIIDGTKSVTSSATALAASTAVSGVEIVADSGNTQNILIGNSTSQNRILAAGAMEINTKVTLSVDDLKDFCDALGWTNDNPLTKQQFFKEAVGKFVKQTIKNKRSYVLEMSKREEVKNGIDQIATDVGAITAE